MRRATSRASCLLVIALLADAVAANAQVPFVDAIARRFSDVSFFASTGGIHPASGTLDDTRLISYGVEILLEIGGVRRPAGPPPQPRDSVRLAWTRMEVIRSNGVADTVYHYDVRPVVVQQPIDTIWSFEVGLGYGQMHGFALRDPTLDMRGAVRDLPSISLYANYEPIGTYLGVRSGFMRFHGLQVFTDAGTVHTGEAESFMAGFALGQALDLKGVNLFVEAAYTWRDFPSIRWAGAAPIPAAIPRRLGLNGWSLGGGLQFRVGG